MAIGLTPKEQRQAQNIIGASQAAARIEAAGKRPEQRATEIMTEANLRLREARLAPSRAAARVEAAGARFANRAPIRATGFTDTQGINEQELARQQELYAVQEQALAQQQMEQEMMDQEQTEMDLATNQAQVGAITAAEESRQTNVVAAKSREEQMETEKSYFATGIEGTEGTTSSSGWMAWLDTLANAVWQVIRFMRTLVFKNAHGFMGIIAKFVPEFKLPQMALGFAIIGVSLTIMLFMGMIGMAIAEVVSNPIEAFGIIPNDLRMTLIKFYGQVVAL